MIIRNYLTADSLIEEWFEDNEMDQLEINYPKYRRWYNSAVKELQLKKIKKQKVALVYLNNMGTAELPNDIHDIQEVAYRFPEPDCPTTKRQVDSWVQKVWGEDCELEIKLKCDKCKKTTCSCAEPAIDLVIDPMFMQSNPWYAGEATRYGTPYRFSDGVSIYTDRFKLMGYSNNTFHRLQWHVPNCRNLNCVNCKYTYAIDFPYIKTDIAKEGAEVLISYEADIADGDGNLLCPDTPSAILAIKAFFTYKYVAGIAGRTLQDQYEGKAARAQIEWRRWTGIAEAEIGALNYNELIAVFEDNLTRVRNPKRSKTGVHKYRNHLRY